MNSRGRGLRFTAVLALVVLALTGFSRGGHSRHGGGGGGGCSSSHQDHDGSSSSYSSSGGGGYSGGSSYGDSDDDSYDGSDDGSDGTYASSGSGSGGGGYRTHRPTYRSTPTASSSGGRGALQDGTAKLISCAAEQRPYATVEVTNPNDREADFRAQVTFYDAAGIELLTDSSPTVSVPAKGKARVRVAVGAHVLTSVDHCEAEPEAEVTP
ncbi:hypothetical protein OIB37_16775 [Streptomyces sp. NBC_00820]|uniref:hypothetical protein n=1 Tax=Streptomyces sp. NBC_00820 TaxID=2975842 RepID=UPI002ED397DD|nr:hypothetical protein OIB37_16775 [Streptomyces sp. NBC_00820]